MNSVENQRRGGTVAFVTAIIPAYKLWIYRALDARYSGRFVAVHSSERPGTLPVDVRDTRLKNDVRVEASFIDVGRVELTWLHTLRWFLRTRPAVLILQDGVRILSNYALHTAARLFGTRILYYGHGSNRQSGTTRSRLTARITEWVRRRYLAASDGVIVYSESIRRELARDGLRTEVFVAPNMIDADEARSDLSRISNSTVAAFRESHAISDSDFVIVTVSRLVSSKRVDGFIHTVKLLNAQMANRVVGLVVGDGPEREQLESLSVGSRVVFLGHKERMELRVALRASDLMYLPGPVGLAVVEAFCARLPVVCHVDQGHGPEIDYVTHGHNGVVIAAEERVTGAAESICDLLVSPEALRRLADFAADTADRELRNSRMIDGFTLAIESRPTT